MTEIEIKHVTESTTPEPEITWTLESNTYEAGNFSYDNFFHDHMRKNIPCVIKNISTDWECTKKWVKDGKINYDYMVNQYGNLKAPVANCDVNSFNSHVKSPMKVSDYLKYFITTPRTKLMFLKDWHLRKARPHQNFYTVPNLFASDWLNEYSLDKHKDDFMFVYIGPKDAWTPVHKDVCDSFSWSVNILGKKKWMLFPPGEEKKLKDSSKKRVPLFFEPGKHENVKYYEIIQNEGDAIFVPSNWHHQVINVEDTISINHNWVNGCNVQTVWKSLTETLVLVEKEVEQIKEWPDYPNICQNILRCLQGMHFGQFVRWLTHIGEKRLSQLQGSSRGIHNNYKLGINHITYDLKCILSVMGSMEAHPSFNKKNVLIIENFYILKDFLEDYFSN